MMKAHSRGVATLFLTVLLAVPAFGAVQYRIQSDSITRLQAPLALGAKVKLDRIPVDGRDETLDLQRFEVFARDAEIKVYGANEEVLDQLAPPPVRYYRGRIANEADSLAFVSIEADGRIEGVIFKGDRRFGIGSRPRGQHKLERDSGGYDLFIQESEPMDDIPADGRGFVCEVENRGIGTRPTLSDVVKDVKRMPKTDAALATGTARWLINIAIETDYELFQKAGSSSSNVTTYIGNLIGAMSTIYERDLSAEVAVSYLGMHNAVADPFTIVPGTAGTWNGSPHNCVNPFAPPNDCMTAFHALLEFGDRWHNTPPSAAPRSTTALISGKAQLAGVAWTDTLCQSDITCLNGNCSDPEADGHFGGRYSFNGGIDPPGDNSVPNPNNNAPTYTAPSSNYWPLLELAHETGHNVFSGHTHCRGLNASDQITYGRTHVDYCIGGGSGGCYSGTAAIPLEKGTIMSYCHLISPNFATNTRFTFGKTGEASYVMINELKAAIQAATPSLSTITAPASLGTGASGAASVTNVAGVTYAWTVTNGVINSGQGTNAINFTANVNPVTVEVKATNAAGCSVTDYATVTVTAGGGSDVQYDFDGDGKADILWRENTTGQTIEWLMNGGTIQSSANVHPGGNTGWNIAGIADFDDDGKNDLLWRNTTTGQTYLWTLNAASITSSVSVHPGGNTSFDIVSVGDFNGDDKTDILWRNPTTGQVYLWLMNGAAISSSTSVHPGGNTGWSIVGSGDFSGDGNADILWRENTTGQTILWLMNGATIASSLSVHPGGNTGWTIPFLGDISGDGKCDILWRNIATGMTIYWQMNGAAITSSITLHNGGNTGWSIASLANFDGDSDVDMLWRNNSTGQSVLWTLNAAGIVSSANVHPGGNTGWSIITTK